MSVRKKYLGLLVAELFLFLVVAAGCFYMQVIRHHEFLKKAEAASSVFVKVPARRGDITDRNGLPLAVNRLCLSVEISKILSREEHSLVSKALNIDEKIFSYDVLPFIAARDIGTASASAVSELGIEGVKVISEYTRDYFAMPKLSHVLGFVGAISAEEYENGGEYDFNDKLGKDGIEKLNEDSLRGDNGQKTLRRGQLVAEKPARHGADTVLTIDKYLQQAAETELQFAVRTVEEKTGFSSGGAVVILDVDSGEVLSMASYPDYDLSELSDNYARFIEDESNPLLNRCISGIYEPGSTFKPLVALAGLNEGVITEDEEITDNGIYTYYAPNYAPTCHIWNEKRKTHGSVNVADAISVSCNYFFYDVGRRTGINKISKYAEKFGLGKKTGIELFGEAEGVVASSKTKSPWYSGDTLQASIGQSVNMFTPVQLASYTATLANGGRIYTPHIVKSQEKPEYTDIDGIAEQHYAAVREGMRRCVAEGTAASSFKDASFTAGGKTGTAQVPKGPENGIFIGFAPFEQPEIAISVVLEHGRGTYTADLASKLIEKYLYLKKF